METCAICYERRASIKFFYLSCCRNNTVCSYCREKLDPPRCPYCRQTFHNNKKKPTTPTETLLLCPYDYTSRIERRQVRRILKLELQEKDRLRNRMRSWSM